MKMKFSFWMASLGLLVTVLFAFVGAENVTSSSVAAGAMVAVGVGADACTYQAGPSTYFDLSKLAGTDFSSSSDGYTYKFRLCGVVSDSQCSQVSGSYCQYGGTVMYSCGQWLNHVWSLIDASNPNKGIQLQYNNGDATWCGVARTSTIILNCVASAPAVPSSWTTANPSGTCVYSATASSSAACPSSSKPDSGGGGGGMSGGWIFIVILLVIAVVYIVAGCVYNRQYKGASSSRESCPNHDFWFALPDLVRDGCRFTAAKLCNRSAADYQSVK